MSSTSEEDARYSLEDNYGRTYPWMKFFPNIHQLVVGLDHEEGEFICLLREKIILVNVSVDVPIIHIYCYIYLCRVTQQIFKSTCPWL